MKKFVRDERASILMTFAVVISLVLMITAAAIDITQYQLTQSKFKNTVDNALLSAAATAMSQDPNKVANDFFKANFPNDDSFELRELMITQNASTHEWTATATGEIKTTFGNAIAPSDLVHLASVVRWDTRTKIETVFTIDTSASMCMRTIRSTKVDGSFMMGYVPDPQCHKLEAMKESILYVLDNGFAALESIGGPVYKVGIVPFNHKVKMPDLTNIPSPLTYIETTHTKGDANYYANFEDAEPLSKIYPLTAISNVNDIDNLKSHVRAITQRPEGMGWTRSNIATLASTLMLDPKYHASFDGERPANFGSSDTEKVVVMMTDGANIGCCYAGHPEGNYNNQYLYLYEVDNAHLSGLDKAPNMREWKEKYGIPEVGLCQQMKDAGITIYSVVFDVDDRDVGGQEIKKTYRECASNDQFFFDVSSEEDLKLAYKTIAQSFVKLRIVK